MNIVIVVMMVSHEHGDHDDDGEYEGLSSYGRFRGNRPSPSDLMEVANYFPEQIQNLVK